ncbi:S-layer homology domain-containing protein [Paenibacillus beijingensis]|uniref:SLH domain-containing protein n=1 Tax=Paenibacillus beijingensis TaxID=1126833 RepID=A0A0D5NE63_9BACL|nr:S-layer homology domain-containing protein [Paenibacillus beijingensis]AJY73654.1 hypothetical protein VN24_02190 [Paenibacillus beijingensis]
MMKRLFFTIILFSLLFGQFSSVSAESAAGFKDVNATDWYYSSIQKLLGMGLVNGFSDGTFKPSKEISRAEFLKLISSLLQLPIDEVQPGQKWYTPYLNAVVNAGVHRISDFNGNWDQPITRQEMARIAVRAVDESLRAASAKTSDTQLMYEATKRGIISGLAGGELGLKEKSTRAQATVIMDRILTVLNGGKLNVDKRAASYAEVAYRGTNIETMWGGKMNALPLTHNLSYTVKGTFEQILIIDLSDANSPYRDWVPGLLKVDRKSWKEDYLVAFKVVMENTKIIPKTRVSFKTMVGSPYLMDAIIYPAELKSPINQINFLQMDKMNKVTTWYLATISKEDMKIYQRDNDRFWYLDWNSQMDHIMFAPDGRIFGENKK